MCYNEVKNHTGGIKMKTVKITTEYITLGQFLKLADIVNGGGEAKVIIAEGLVEVNGEVDTRRGRKLRHKDIVTYQNQSYQVEQ